MDYNGWDLRNQSKPVPNRGPPPIWANLDQSRVIWTRNSFQGKPLSNLLGDYWGPQFLFLPVSRFLSLRHRHLRTGSDTYGTSSVSDAQQNCTISASFLLLRAPRTLCCHSLKPFQADSSAFKAFPGRRSLLPEWLSSRGTSASWNHFVSLRFFPPSLLIQFVAFFVCFSALRGLVHLASPGDP